MSGLQVHRYAMFQDNYGFLLHDVSSERTAAVDPGDFSATQAALASKGWKLDAIWNTHHHWDHVDANEALKEFYGCEVVGPHSEAIPGRDTSVQGGDRLSLGRSNALVLETPGHTLGHIAYYFEQSAALFCGDTLFAMGCGRLFEGTAEQLWGSLNQLAKLPSHTKVYCAHEYTLQNALFAVSVDGENPQLSARLKQVQGLRARAEPTIPTNLALELETNPFLRTQFLYTGLGCSSPLEAFTMLRAKKDVF